MMKLPQAILQTTIVVVLFFATGAMSQEESSTNNHNSSSSTTIAAAVLDTLIYYDDLRLNRIDGVDVNVTRDETSKVDWISTSDGQEFALCHIGCITSITVGSSFPSITGFEEVVGVALAIQHLNTGDGSVVPSVAGLNERCPIRFTTEFKDNELDKRIAVSNALEFMDRPAASFDTRRACAFIGARSSAITVPTALLTSVNDFVQVAATATSPALDDPSQYPLFARSVGSDTSIGTAFISYIREVLNVRYLAVINVNDALGNLLADEIRLLADTLYPGQMIIHQIPLDEDARSIKEVVANLKRTKYRYVLATLHTRATHDALMIEAVEQNVAGNGLHQWFFGSSFGTVLSGNRAIEKGSALYKAYSYVGQVAGTALTELQNSGDEFLSEFAKMNNPTDVAYLNTRFPHEQHAGSPLYEGGAAVVKSGQFLTDMSQTFVQTRSEALYYDAMIAVGLGACQAYETKGTAFTGKDHFDGIVNSSFQGVTGEIILNNITGTRDYASMGYHTMNHQPVDINETHVEFAIVITDNFENGEWIKKEDFLFNDGTANIPADIPPPELDDNAISPTVRGIVLVLCGTAIGLAIAFSMWTIIRAKSHVVRASQPFFLHTISMGTIVMASSIIPLSYDHVLASDRGNMIACNCTLWLVCLGFAVTFSALFTKNYRIITILKTSNRMRRVAVSVKDVAIPMVCLLASNAIVLSLMTALAPITFETIIVNTDEFDRDIETISSCTFDDGQGPYLLTLSIINAGCLLIAIFQAYQARHLSTEFGESHYVFLALIITLLVCAMGIPVLLLASENKDAYTFVAGAIIWVTCCSILLVIFVPKIRYYNSVGDDKDRFREALKNITLGSSGVEKIRPGSSYNTDSETSDRTGSGGGIEVYGLLSKEELVLKTEELMAKVEHMTTENKELRKKLELNSPIPASKDSSKTEESLVSLPEGELNPQSLPWRSSEAVWSSQPTENA